MNMVKQMILAAVIAVQCSFAVQAADNIEKVPANLEVHGKPTVHVSEKLNLPITGATYVSWSPDDAVLGVSSNYGMKLNTYDQSGNQLSEFQSNGTHSTKYKFAFINGSSQVLFPIDGTAKKETLLDIRDVKTGNILNSFNRTVERPYFPNTTGDFTASPDQKRFVAAPDSGTRYVIYAAENFQDWHELSVINTDTTVMISSLCFFPDSKLLVVGKNDGKFSIIDSTTGKTVKEFHAYDTQFGDASVSAIAVSPKSDLIITGRNIVAINSQHKDSKDSAPIDVWRDGRKIATYVNSSALKVWEDESSVYIWRINDGKKIASLPNVNKKIWQAVWDPKGRFVAFVDDHNLYIWQPEVAGENYIKIPYPAFSLSLAMSHDGKSLAVTGGDRVTIYNIGNN